MEIPQHLDEVTPEWLTWALRESGVLDQATVNACHAENVGEGVGFLGEVFKLSLNYSTSNNLPAAGVPVAGIAAAGAPASMILKLPTESANRNAGQSAGVYEREIRFYSELRPELNIRTPTCYYGGMQTTVAPETGLTVLRFINRLPMWSMWSMFRLLSWLGTLKRIGYILLIEDLGHLRRGDQVAGCGLQDARTALTAMARLHGQFWESEKLESTKWIIPLQLTTKLGQVVYQKALPRYFAANGQVTLRNRELLEWLDHNGLRLMEQLASTAPTLIHGDFRLDNLFFDDVENEVVVLDWQTPLCGPFGMDLAYFLSASLESGVSEAELTNLLEHYRAELALSGVVQSADQIRWHYEASMLLVLFRVIPAEYQDMLSLGDDRGHELAITWIERIFAKLQHIDLDAILHKPA